MHVREVSGNNREHSVQEFCFYVYISPSDQNGLNSKLRGKSNLICLVTAAFCSKMRKGRIGPAHYRYCRNQKPQISSSGMKRIFLALSINAKLVWKQNKYNGNSERPSLGRKEQINCKSWRILYDRSIFDWCSASMHTQQISWKGRKTFTEKK